MVFSSLLNETKQISHFTIILRMLCVSNINMNSRFLIVLILCQVCFSEHQNEFSVSNCYNGYICAYFDRILQMWHTESQEGVPVT